MRSKENLPYALLGAIVIHIMLFMCLLWLNNVTSFKKNTSPVINLQYIAPTPAQPPKHQANIPAQPKNPIKTVTTATDKVITSNHAPLIIPTSSIIETVKAITSTTQITASTTNTNESIQESTMAVSDITETTFTEPIFDADFLHNPPPNYPVFALRRLQQGTVLLRVKVSIEGKAEVIELNKSSGFKLLDETAQNTVKTWRFVPAKRGDNAVNAWVIVPITFKLN